MKTPVVTSVREKKLEFLREIRIPVPWGHLAAKVWGSENGVPAIALHGMMDNAGSFDTLAPLLPSQIHLVCLELTGHGNSSAYPPGVILYYFDHVYHLKRVVDYLKWEKFILIGHSIGAIIAINYTSLFPEKVTKLVSLDISKPFSVSLEKLPARMQGILAQMEAISQQNENGPQTMTYEEARTTLVDNYKGSVDEKSAEILLNRGLTKKGDNTYEFKADLRTLVHTLTLTEDQIKVIVKNISCPFLIIRAKDGLKNFSENMLKEYLNLYSQFSIDFRFVEVDGTHHLHLTHPERVAPYICDFILSTSPSSKL